MEQNKALWNLVNNIWKNGTSWTEKYKKFYDYYDGKLKKKLYNEDKTSNNIIEEIIEEKEVLEDEPALEGIEEGEDEKGYLDELAKLGEKSVVTLGEIINPEEEEEEELEKEDSTEITRKYSVEEEIQGLKDIISYLNDKNQFKKALIYQRRLVKLAREENIKAHVETDLKQRTLSDF